MTASPAPSRRRPPVPNEYAMSDEHTMRQMEMTILSQLRDNMTKIGLNMDRLSDKVDTVNDNVVAIMAKQYDEQIEGLKREHAGLIADQEVRIRDHEKQLAKLGLGMAIAACVASLALGAVIVIIITRVFGGTL